jgi:small-conductance mechanosensitive channel
MDHGDEAPLRIIWISSAYDITDEENQIFIEKIQRDQSQTKGSIVLKSSIEDLKKYYRQKVALSTSPLSQPDDSIDVYLVSDDSLCEQKVIKELGERRVSASSHINNISYTQHLRLLSKATSVVVCNTSNNPKWLAVKANDVLKSKGIDRAKQFEKVILYKNDKALDLETPEGVFTDVVDNLSDLHKIFNQSSNK